MATPTNKPLRKSFGTDWFKDLSTATEKDDRAQMVVSASPTLQILANILTKRLNDLEDTYNYDTPAWQFKIASDLGGKKELKYLLKLLTPVLEQE